MSNLNINSRGMLKIRPLSPLSMVSSIPGSFYRSNSEPTNTMVYGMLENMMGWHYSDQIRISLKKYLQKQFKKEKRSFSEESAESGYTPLIQNFISIEKLFVRPTSKSFNDLFANSKTSSSPDMCLNFLMQLTLGRLI